MFAVATAGVLGGALSSVSESLGLLAVLVLFASESFVSQIASQYADIPMSFFVLATIAVFAFAAERDWPPGLLALAGVLAGLAAWTKNEGLPFVIAALAVALWRAKFAAKWFVAGAALPVGATLALKLFLAEGTESMFPKSIRQAAHLIAEPSRWAKIIASFGNDTWTLGFLWAHPIVLLAILGLALRYVPRETRKWWLFAAPAALLAADFGIYLITMADLDWHLNTSSNRLVLQVWPAILFGYVLMLRTPPAAEEPINPRKAARKRARSSKPISLHQNRSA
jgi:hypothetical protein